MRFSLGFRLLYITLEIIGFVNQVQFRYSWLNKLKTLRHIIFHIILVTAIISHFISTTCLASRYMPEFYQRLFEDISNVMYYINCMFYFLNYDRIHALMKFMDTSFCYANDKVVTTCVRRIRLVFIVFLIVNTITMIAVIAEMYKPVSQKESDVLAEVYQKKYSEGHVPVKYWMPFIDEMESWYFEALLKFAFYQFTNYAVMVIVSMCSIPMIVIVINAQYTILAEYVEKIGHEHRDEEGRRIRYTNIITNEIVYVEEEGRKQGSRRYEEKPAADIVKDNEIIYVRELSEQNEPRKQIQMKGDMAEEKYQQDYFRQVLQFHQMIMDFQGELLDMYHPFLTAKVLLFNLNTALCIYQVTTNPTSFSESRKFKVICELIGVAQGFYLICFCSERLDDCHGKLRQAVAGADWGRSSPKIRKALQLLLTMAQTPNHMEILGGVLVISNAYFQGMVQFAYSFVNFMKLKMNA
ncbi:hypothetical protein M8J77_002177 [Diaphorina citri]|nr:hypothetical protein M8J77_002177 [Diaphorina citri]